MTTQQSDSPGTPLEYMPQLDGLRAVAVSAVIAQHYTVLVGGAGYGVHLFFVLSGFLITRILLVERENVSTLGITRVRAFRQFYLRRMLRIFPLYYFVVLAGIALNVRNAREYAPWLLTYTFNLKMAAQGTYVDTFAHFWSLAIEEQYYLVWPWLILLLPRRRLATAAVITTAIAPLFRLYLALTGRFGGPHDLWAYVGTPTALDSLGIGSLIAILMSRESSAQMLRRSMEWVVPVIAFVLVVVLEVTPHGLIHHVFLDTAAAMFFGWLIYTASRGFSGITGKILAAAPLVFVGKISYGIYVYHPYVPAVTVRLARRFLGVTLPIEGWIAALFYVSLTIAVATLSWYAFERPINRLKRKFPYPATSLPGRARQSSA